LLNWLVVAATVALVATPVAVDQLRLEIARWHLAAATNAVSVHGTDPGPHLARVQALVKEPEAMRDYWLFRIKQALATAPDSVPDELQQAIAADVNNAELTSYVAASLWEIKEFDAQIDALELGRNYFQSVSTSTLNQLAYARALTSRDLHKALEDINRAIEVDPNNFAIRDTRAWVLFKMGKPLDAIEDVQFAIKALDELEQSDWLGSLLGWFEQAIPSAASTAPADAILTREQAGEWLWGKGALIYHRAKILDALGRADEAQQDWQWLKDHRLPQDDRIY
jgi:tetratricopeptide (TPR) repeat protein